MTDLTQLTPGEIKRANFWIRRWKMIGGGFKVHDLPEALVVEPVRAADPDPKHDAPLAKAAGALIDELEKNGKKQRHVFDMVQAAHEHRRKVETPGAQIIDHAGQADNDTDDPPEVA